MPLGLEGTSISAPSVVAAPPILPCVKTVVTGVAQNAAAIKSSPAAGSGDRAGILAYYDYPISTGPLEGTNNKIKTMNRQAYGFRDLEFFKLKILAIHQAKYALVG